MTTNTKTFLCPHCQRLLEVGHLDWFRLVCQFCRKEMELIQHTADTCPGKPCSEDCDHIEIKAVDRARDQAQAQLDSIKLMVERLEHARGEPSQFTSRIDHCDWEEDCPLTQEDVGLDWDWSSEADRERYHDEDAAHQDIRKDPLFVEVRSGWHSPGYIKDPEEYRILLRTGGPAVMIEGRLDMDWEPDSARLLYQDWGTPWEELILDDGDYQVLLTYASQFYFGE